MKKSLKYCVIFILCITVYNFVSLFYMAKSISGVVSDAVTGKPVFGAVVVAKWFSERPGFHSPNSEEFVVQEVVTDTQGRYKIPGWWLKFLPRIFASLKSDNPEILAYKYDYIPEKTDHIRYEYPDIKMTPLSGTQEEKIKALQNGPNIGVSISSNCSWKNVKLLLLESDKQFEANELYYAHLQQNDASLVTPWFLDEINRVGKVACPGAVDLLINARKLRSKE